MTEQVSDEHLIPNIDYFLIWKEMMTEQVSDEHPYISNPFEFEENSAEQAEAAAEVQLSTRTPTTHSYTPIYIMNSIFSNMLLTIYRHGMTLLKVRHSRMHVSGTGSM